MNNKINFKFMSEVVELADFAARRKAKLAGKAVASTPKERKVSTVPAPTAPVLRESGVRASRRSSAFLPSSDFGGDSLMDMAVQAGEVMRGLRTDSGLRANYSELVDDRKWQELVSFVNKPHPYSKNAYAQAVDTLTKWPVEQLIAQVNKSSALDWNKEPAFYRALAEQIKLWDRQSGI